MTVKRGVLYLLTALFMSCQINFFMQNGWGENSIRGATDLDRELIFRLESLRISHENGELGSNDGVHDDGSITYVVQVEDNKFYVSFFGTDNATEVYYDMIHWKEPYWTNVDSDIGVHAGFNRPLQSVAPAIKDELNTFLAGSPVNPEVYILGHSAGGVHAVLCTFYLAQEIPVLDVDNFYCQIAGAPAPGNEAFANVFDGDSRITSHRYINGNDMMPSLFTEEMGYKHVGQPYRIGPEPDIFTTSTVLWLSDHSLSAYADSLR